MNPQRAFPSVLLVRLGDGNNSEIGEYISRFAIIPDDLELNHLTVSGGDVTFGKNVSSRGTVIIIANHIDHIGIPANTRE